MTTINRDEVMKVAHLARLAITEDKIDEYTKNLSNILDLVEQMNEIDTEGIEPMANPLDALQRLREDVVTESNQRELMLSLAPNANSDFYLVPKVLE